MRVGLHLWSKYQARVALWHCFILTPIFRKNKVGGMGHFIRRPGSAQLFPVHLNDEKLPVLPIKGFKSTFQSVPDTLEEYAAEMLESCRRPDAGPSGLRRVRRGRVALVGRVRADRGHRIRPGRGGVDRRRHSRLAHVVR